MNCIQFMLLLWTHFVAPQVLMCWKPIRIRSFVWRSDFIMVLQVVCYSGKYSLWFNGWKLKHKIQLRSSGQEKHIQNGMLTNADAYETLANDSNIYCRRSNQSIKQFYRHKISSYHVNDNVMLKRIDSKCQTIKKQTHRLHPCGNHQAKSVCHFIWYSKIYPYYDCVAR